MRIELINDWVATNLPQPVRCEPWYPRLESNQTSKFRKLRGASVTGGKNLYTTTAATALPSHAQVLADHAEDHSVSSYVDHFLREKQGFHQEPARLFFAQISECLRPFMPAPARPDDQPGVHAAFCFSRRSFTGWASRRKLKKFSHVPDTRIELV